MRENPVTGVNTGDRDTALANEIVRVEVGSTAHGMGTGADDLDLMGVYIETPEQLLGVAPSREHYVSRTQPEGVRSGPGGGTLLQPNALAPQHR